MVVFPVEIDHPVGAVDHTVAAADALFGIMHGDTVFDFVHGPGGTASHAGCIGAVVAKSRQVMKTDIRENTGSFGDLVGPVYSLGHIVFGPAGNAAGAAADASLTVDDHGISGHFSSP
jgi:prolipoprotein diacylglyceryltransferase